MQFNAAKKNKKQTDQTRCSVSSAELAQKVVKVKFGQIPNLAILSVYILFNSVYV